MAQAAHIGNMLEILKKICFSIALVALVLIAAPLKLLLWLLEHVLSCLKRLTNAVIFAALYILLCLYPPALEHLDLLIDPHGEALALQDDAAPGTDISSDHDVPSDDETTLAGYFRELDVDKMSTGLGCNILTTVSQH